MEKNWIKKFSEFTKEKKLSPDKILYIFDFDDTLAQTPSFPDFAKEYLVKETENVRRLLDKSLEYIEKNISDLKYENGRIYFDDPLETCEIKGNWVRKKSRVYLTSPWEWDNLPESFPTLIKPETVQLYQSRVESSAIVSARPKSSEEQFHKSLLSLGLEKPKYGIWLRPDTEINIGSWKGETIYQIATKNGFKCVAFLDDNPKVIKKAKQTINKLNPEFSFTTFKID